MEKIVIVYRSRTGFTREYAELAAAKLGCRALPLEAAGREALSGCDVLVFGGRVHAGRIDGLKRARALYQSCGAKRFVVFATGATPATETEIIEGIWRNNLGPEERERVPHFYMQSGMREAGLSWMDRLILRAVLAMLRRDAGREADAAAFACPRDISSPAYVEPMVRFLKEGGEQRAAVETGAAAQMVDRVPEDQSAMAQGCREALLVTMDSEPSGAGYTMPEYLNWQSPKRIVCIASAFLWRPGRFSVAGG